MKAAKAWCVAGLFAMAGFGSVSCGKDEANGGKNTGGGIVGGNGGANSGGTRTEGGTSGSGGGDAVQTKLGQGCINDDQCEDETAPGLKCITSTDTVLNNGAPPGGLCTAECDASDLDSCLAFGPEAICYPFTEGSDAGHCVEGCWFGPPGIGETKCHNRDEFACLPVAYGDLMAPCTSTIEDCEPGELCIEGSCHLAFPACLPTCRADLDCDAGMFCDQSLFSGVCVEEQPTGKRLGEPCTMPADGEDDECLGFCQGDGDMANPDAGHCAVACGIGQPCAYDSASELFDGICFYATILTRTAETSELGDFGFCTPSCNCSSECNDAALGCEIVQSTPLPDDYKGRGLCFAPDEMSEVYDQCEGAGGSGTGGAPSGDAGSPADPGMGGGGAGG